MKVMEVVVKDILGYLVEKDGGEKGLAAEMHGALGNVEGFAVAKGEGDFVQSPDCGLCCVAVVE
jgi:hypothetical protein